MPRTQNSAATRAVNRLSAAAGAGFESAIEFASRIVKQSSQAVCGNAGCAEGAGGLLFEQIGSRDGDLIFHRIFCDESLDDIIRGATAAGIKNLDSPGLARFA